MNRKELEAELRSLSGHEGYRRLLAKLDRFRAEADSDAIFATSQSDVARGRARGIRELLALITPE